MKTEHSFLHRLPAMARNRLLALATPCPMTAGDILAHANAPTRFVYFPDSGVVSLSARRGNEHGGLIMLIGRESLVGASVVLGHLHSPLDATVVIAGNAHRMTTARYLQLFQGESALGRLNQAALSRLFQRACLANLCVQHHRLIARLAGLLVEMALRCHSDTFLATHETLAALLGVRREGISLQAADLRGRGLITYRRGVMTVTDGVGLRETACECGWSSPE